MLRGHRLESGGLFDSQPGQEQAVGLHVFPIGNEPARDLAAVASAAAFPVPCGVNHFSHSGVSSLPQCSAFLSMITMRPPGFDHAADLAHRSRRSRPRAPATRWRRRASNQSSSNGSSVIEPARVWMPAGTKRSISSEMSSPQISASGCCSWKTRANRPLPQPTSSTRLPRRSPRCSRISLT